MAKFQITCDVCGSGDEFVKPGTITDRNLEANTRAAFQNLAHWYFIDGKDVCLECKGKYERLQNQPENSQG